MKKILILTIALALSLAVIAGCSAVDPGDTSEAVTLETDESLAFSAYLATGLIAEMTDLNLYAPAVNLDTEEAEPTLEVETELDEVNAYFNKLKVFMDNNGVDTALQLQEQASTKEGYTHMMSFTLEDVAYTLHYSLKKGAAKEDVPADEDVTEEEVFEMNGLLIMNQVEYQLTGKNEISAQEKKMWFEATDPVNAQNKVRIEKKVEDGEQKFNVESTVNGETRRSEIKFENEGNEAKVQLKLMSGENESQYTFRRETEDGETGYKFTYRVGQTEGEVKISETETGDGYTYRYQIKEGGVEKSVEKTGKKVQNSGSDNENSQDNT